jgi:hypothetical protein
MINRQSLLSDLQKLLQKLEADLLERSVSAEVPEVGVRLKEEHERATKAQRTAQNYEDWRTDAITQAAAAWVLSCVFVRFLEDNRLIDPPKISGPASGSNGQSEDRLGRARDEHELYFRKHPKQTDREYLLSIFDQLAKLPGTKDVFGEHNPIRELPNWLSGDAAGELLKFFQKIDANTGALVHDFTDSNWDTRFLGDLYQDLSEAARKKYALLQTPEFVEEFILDRTLDPALDEFGLEPPPASGEEDISYDSPSRDSKLVTRRFRMIDPACGSGHFLLGSFPRILDRWMKKEPGTNVRELVQRTLDSIHGVDVNPFAIAIARFRLLLAALKACGIQRLADAPAFEVSLVCGDSLLHAPLRTGQQVFDFELTSGDAECEHAYQSEDLPVLKRMLRGGQYHAVVANPPYILAKDATLNQRYRSRYSSCHMKYSLAVPFMQRIYGLTINGGFTGQITANSFMKREFGKKLIESFFPTVDLTHVVDTSGAYIPGHGTPTVILLGRHRRPVASTLRTVMGIRGEPSTPSDPARGLVWSAIVAQLDNPDSQSEFVSVGDSPRELFHQHPWSIGGGGASELKERIDATSSGRLVDRVEAIGPMAITGSEECFVAPKHVWKKLKCRSVPYLVGDQIRDWQVFKDDHVMYPYGDGLTSLPLASIGLFGHFGWPNRALLRERKMFGKTATEAGIGWYEYRYIERTRAGSTGLITFAYVATHNHFARLVERVVTNQHATVILFKQLCSQHERIAILGLLNSAIGCFWMKQVFYPKASSTGDISIEKGKPEENRYEFGATGLEQFPIPFALDSPDSVVISQISCELDSLARRLQCSLPDAILQNWQDTDYSRLKTILQQQRQIYSTCLDRIIALQEELDWESYRIFGLTEFGASEAILQDCDNGVPADARPFLWKTDDAPDAVPLFWRETYEHRRRLCQSVSELALIEDPIFKRPWWGRQGVYGRLSRNYETWILEALARWFLDRLEGYFDFDGRLNDASDPTAKLDVELVSVAKLAEVARQDAGFHQFGEVYRDDPAFDVQALVDELVAAECVPLLPVLRYKPAGLIKRITWDRTWDLQRQEDAIDARTQLPASDSNYLTEDAAKALKEKQVGKIPVPTKYDAKDFLTSDFWRLRGKLDVPKERWISFPHCDGPDGTMMLCWAGYDHLQQARAISAYYVQVQTEFGGSDDPRLIPLLACLIELLPWLKQWHNDLDPEFNMSMGDYFEGFINEEARQLGKTLQEIKDWVPPAKAPGRRSRKARS